MEINKISFEQLKTIGISQSFEDLDMNDDGVINETDKNLAGNYESKIISNLLITADEEAELSNDSFLTKTGATKDDASVEDDAKVNAENDAAEETENADDTKDASEDKSADSSALQAQLDAVKDEIASLTSQITTLENSNTELNATKTKLEAEQTQAQDDADKAKETLEAEQKKLDEYNSDYAKYQTDIENVNKEILKEQGREEEDFNNSMNALVDKAINDYNPATDGDFNTYFMRKMDEQGFPTFSKLNDLNYDAQVLSSDAKALLSNIMLQAGVVSAAKTALDSANATLTDVTSRLNNTIDEINANNLKIDDLKPQLEAKQTEKAGLEKDITSATASATGKNVIEGGEENLSAAELLALISDEEKALAKANVKDLSKCVIAKAMDGQWHIYESGDNWAQAGVDGYYMSVARKYGEGTGWSKGSDLTGWGSGELSMSDSSRFGVYSCENNNTCISGAVYKLNSVNDCWTDGEVCCSKCCYDTDSPLSFDVDGNGINTTDETVSFDIDGDGVLDTVNNADEWVLAFDKDKDGIAGEDGSELFGNNTDIDGDGKADGYKDGFAALKALAEKEGLIGNGDNKLDEADIQKLTEKYGLTMTKGYGGEAKSLADLGITEINIAATDETSLTKNFDGKNNDIMTQEGATFVVNGETRDYADIWNAKKDESEAVFKNTDETLEKVTATIHDMKANINLNQHGVVALEGNIDFGNIKDKAVNGAEAPGNIFQEAVEIKEELEE